MRALFVVFTVCAALSSRAAQDLTVEPGRPARLELEETGEPVSLRSATRGQLRVWAECSELDLGLVIFRADGSIAGADEDAGGGTTPFLSLHVDAGELIDIVVEPEGQARLVLHAALGAETEGSRAALSAARVHQSNAADLLAGGEDATARAELETACGLLIDALAASDDPALDRELWDFGRAHGALLGPATLERLVQSALAHRARTLPPGHVDLLGARANAGWMKYLRGELTAGQADVQRTYEEAVALRGAQDLFCARLAVPHGFLAWRVGAFSSAESALTSARSVLAEHLPEIDGDSFLCRQTLANVYVELGELEHARELWLELEPLIERTFAAGDARRHWARQGLAYYLSNAGELARAAEIQADVVEELARSGPASAPELPWVTNDLAETLARQGHFARSSELFEQVLGTWLQTLPEDHLYVARARSKLAQSLLQLGQVPRALELLESALPVLEREMPEENPILRAARVNHALALIDLERAAEAEPILEGILAEQLRILPHDHATVGVTLLNLASACVARGDLSRARILAERAVDIAEQHEAENPAMLLAARSALARTLHDLGDHSTSSAILERSLEAVSRSFDEGSVYVLELRSRVAHAWVHLGRIDLAREMLESVLSDLSQELDPDSARALTARLTLADIHRSAGRVEEAIDVLGDELERVRQGDGSITATTLWLFERQAWALASAGRLPEARSLLLEALADLESAPAPSQKGQRALLHGLAGVSSAQGDLEVATDAALRAGRSARSELESSALTLGPLEQEGRARLLSVYVSGVLSLALTHPDEERRAVLAEEAFVLVESLRGAALTSARALVEAADVAELVELRARARDASTALARAVQEGRGSDALLEASMLRDSTLRELTAAAARDERTQALLSEPWPRALAAQLGSEEALIGYFAFRRLASADGLDLASDALAAAVLRAGGELQWFDLGSLEEVRTAVDRWRQHLCIAGDRGVAAGVPAGVPAPESGERLRALVLDPLEPALAGVRRVTVAVDDALHAVPLDALPQGEGRVGDTLRIRSRSTLRELLWPARRASEGPLVVLGGASFDAAPGKELEIAHALRGAAWGRGFAPLPETAAEARGIAALYAEVFGPEASAHVLLRDEASRAALERFASGARWLHLATHGWFAPESVRSIDELPAWDAGPGLETGARTEERVRASSPRLLCGLALAGANLPPEPDGRIPGLITAEELSTFDLGGCELAVLSACDTNVGVVRAGQGVASLQEGLHMAGARSVIASLWKVPDEATRELMLELYRRMWVLQESKADALWGAKQRLRAARDPQGRPLYGTRDWAGWVLSGEAG